MLTGKSIRAHLKNECMKRILTYLIATCCCPLLLLAQTEKEMKEFEDFVKQEQRAFNDFVEEQNKEFANFLKENWKEYNLENPVARPKKPEPVKPTVFDKSKPVAKPQEIRVGDVTALPKPDVKQPEKQPVKPPVKQPDMKQPEKQPVISPSRSGVSFAFYGETCVVNEELKKRLSLNGISEKDVASGWESLCARDYQKLIDDCQAIKQALSLNDWGYLLLAKTVADKLCGSERPNEAALMQMFILCQSGYQSRVARVGNRLILLYATNDMIYGATFVTLQGVNYYMFNYKGNKGESIYTYTHDFGSAPRQIKMNITENLLAKGELKKRQLQAKDFPVKVESEVNAGLIAFYKDYPQCDFSVYVGAPMSEEVKRSVLPPLKAAIAGKSQAQAANLLLNFVQTAFPYQTDDQQFGYEKPFFADELFFYPYCDCEDRSVLYSYLVRTLMGLDVVLLDYPRHIATAVRFTEKIAGDYVTVGGQTYIICDPTYIGASIGMAMPQFKNVAVKVLKY